MGGSRMEVRVYDLVVVGRKELRVEVLMIGR